MNDTASLMVHVAIGGCAGGELRSVVSPVVAMMDDVLMGPSSTDPKRHLSLRVRYWNAPHFTDIDSEIGTQGPLCVYLPPTASGLLSLCRVCSIAFQQKREVFVVDLRGKRVKRSRGIDPDQDAFIVIGNDVEHLPPPVRWSSIEVAFAATLWKLWCRRSPTAFSRFCAAGSRLHPLMSDLARLHAGFFPRLSGDCLLPARFDELLLRELSQEWLTPVKIIVNAVKADSELEKWFRHIGDLYFADRLQAWFHHTQGRIVERRQEQHPNNPEMLGWSFRWHPGGEAILEALPSLSAGPPVEIGGAVAYDPRRPWISCVDANGPHVRKLARFGSSARNDG
jgi:hypothetical protein